MPLDPEAIADIVVQTVETALGSVLERLAAAEARLSTLGDLRDRVVTVETKAAIPPQAFPEPVPIDLGPVLERLAAAEARLAVLGDLRDRVVTVETKSAQPAPPPPPVVDLAPVLERILSLERRAMDDSLTKELGTLRERVAVVEVIQPVPGPRGADGVDGKDGADGFGFDDLDFVIDESRKGCFLRFTRGDQVKEFRLPTPLDIGTYQPGEHYYKGNGLTWSGSWWLAKAETSDKPGDGATAWRLSVKRGQNGADGKPGADGKAGRDLTPKEGASWRS